MNATADDNPGNDQKLNNKDVTDAISGDARAHASKAFLQAVNAGFASSGCGFCVVDRTGQTIIYANEAFCRLVNHPETTIITSSFFELFDESSLKPYSEQLKQVSSLQLASASIDVQLAIADGAPKWVHLTLSNIEESHSGFDALLVVGNEIAHEFSTVKAFQKAVAKYHKLFAATSTACLIVADELIIECNKRAVQLLEHREQDILGKRLVDFSPQQFLEDESRKNELSTICVEVEIGQHRVLAWEFLRPNKTVISAELTFSKIYTDGTEYLLIAIEDVSEHQVIQDILQRKNELLQRNHDILYNLARQMEKDLYSNLNLITEISAESMNVASVGIWVMNKNTSLFTALDYFVSDDKSHHTSLTATLDDFGPEGSKFFISLFIESTSFGKLKNEGSDFLITPFRVGNQVKGFVHFENREQQRQWNPEEKDFALSIADIVVLSLENESYQKSQIELKKLGRAIEQSPVSVFITNTRGEFEYVNPAFTTITGYTFEDLQNKTPRILSSGLTDPGIYKDLWSTITRGETFTTEIQNSRKNGQIYWESLIISPIKDDANNISHFIALMEDITEKKNLILEITESKDQAESANKVKSNFLANMSHELRTPMNGIIGYAEVLSEELREPEYQNMAETIFRSGKRLMETLNLILDLSRIEANQVEINWSNVELTGICEECVVLFKESARKKGLQLFIKEFPYKMTAYTDEKIIRSILINLINNAIKYTDTGSVWIECDTYEQNGDRFGLLKICDTGIGISEKDQKVIFEQFRQASEGMNRAFDGTGLGLTISQKMIEFLDGKITVAGKPGSGSVFSIHIPLRGGAVISRPIEEIEAPTLFAEEEITDQPKGIEYNILVVENDAINLEVVATYLLNDFNLVIATDGKSAIAKAEESVFDAILMDINLGKGMTGLDAVQIIRKFKGYEKVPIIAMTAFAMKGDKEEFLSAGCSHYLAKPFTRKALIQLLNTALSIGLRP